MDEIMVAKPIRRMLLLERIESTQSIHGKRITNTVGQVAAGSVYLNVSEY